MGIIATAENQTKLYYSSETSLGKQTLAYVTSAEKKIVTIDTSKTNVPGSHWAEIASGLGEPVAKLIDTEHPNFKSNYGKGEVDLDDHDWLRILEEHPETLAYPVVIVGNEFHFIESPSDFERLKENDSTGQENPY